MRTRTISAVGLVTLLCLAGAAQARTIRVPADYPGLTEAAAAAKRGDRIIVEEGATGVHAEIRGKSRLSIVGAEGVVLDADGSDAVLTIRDCDRVTVKGLVLANAGTDGLRVYDSERIVIRDCVVRDSSRAGIYVGDVERLKLQDNVIDAAGFHGIWLSPSVGKKPTTAMKVIRNVVTDCGEDGIRLVGDGHLVGKNEIARCDEYGIHVTESVRSSVIRNDVSDVGNGGIWVDGEKNRVDKNYVRHTVDDGIGIYGDRNRATKNLIEGAEDDGIELEDGSRNKILRNEILFSGEHGIAVYRAVDNKIIRNDVRGSGVYWNGVDLRDYGGPDVNTWKKNEHETSDFSPLD